MRKTRKQRSNLEPIKGCISTGPGEMSCTNMRGGANAAPEIPIRFDGCSSPIHDHISCFVHGTNIENVKTIIDAGHIKNQPGNIVIQHGGFTYTLNKGAYVQAIFNCNKTKAVTDAFVREVYFVFSTKILDINPSYHISSSWCGGIMYPPAGPRGWNSIKSFNRLQLQQYFDEYSATNCETEFPKNEVVINQDIPLSEYLEEIWIIDLPGRRVNDGGGIHRKPRATHDTATLEASVKASIAGTPYVDIPIKVITTIPDQIYRKGC